MVFPNLNDSMMNAVQHNALFQTLCKTAICMSSREKGQLFQIGSQMYLEEHPTNFLHHRKIKDSRIFLG